MKEVEFNGDKYKSDGKDVWKNGVLLDIQVGEQIGSIEQITALKVDDKIYYNDKFYLEH